MKLRPPPRGFTLLELLAVLAIAAILLAIAMPQLTTAALRSTRAQGSTGLLAAFNQARSEAIARNGGVFVCRRDYFATGDFPKCALGSGTWAQGWIVYRDGNGVVDAQEPGAAGDIVAVFDPVGRVEAGSAGDAFRIVPTTNPAYVQFKSDGRPTQALSFTLCDKQKRLPDARSVLLGLSGAVNLVEVDAASASALCG